ncbi:ATP-binding protein [Caenispirillum salinarum]|uniref:sensor histidine kinase n=1 Tax=Caenispirillum salinarum TaxID=859058 RepID=UPI00384C0EAE
MTAAPRRPVPSRRWLLPAAALLVAAVALGVGLYVWTTTVSIERTLARDAHTLVRQSATLATETADLAMNLRRMAVDPGPDPAELLGRARRSRAMAAARLTVVANGASAVPGMRLDGLDTLRPLLTEAETALAPAAAARPAALLDLADRLAALRPVLVETAVQADQFSTTIIGRQSLFLEQMRNAVLAFAVLSGTGGVIILLLLDRLRGARHRAEAAAAEAEAAASDLERSNAELAQFAYVASHDLREPLRMVTSYMSLLDRRYGGDMAPEAREFMHHASDGAKRMDRLVLDLLEYSRVGRREAAVDSVDLDRVLDAALENLRVARDEAGAAIERPERLPSVVGSPGDLTRLFQNLIGNALKYRSPDRPPRIEIGCDRRGGEAADGLHLWIADNGIGMDPRHTERVFGLFQRLHPRGSYEGTGIGLAVVRKVVERHGGRAWIDSAPGEGTTVHVVLGTRQATRAA